MKNELTNRIASGILITFLIGIPPFIKIYLIIPYYTLIVKNICYNMDNQ